MENVFDVLKERGFVQQLTHEEPLRKLLGSEQVTAYVGYDPTADSLHVGHMITIMALAHLQRHGHRPIALMGGGTGMIGDPTGKTEMRPILTLEEIDYNVQRQKAQMARFLDFSAGRAILANNADWLRPLKYIDFLREIGSQFSVNRMLTAECFKARMERGLSFLEFNYMLLQAYDFLMLYRQYGCRLQMGGDDQWSNIIAGADLIRRLEQQEAYGLTIPLLMTSSGKKMGKTESGAVWLDAERTSPYEFYQYWRNVEDADVERFLALYTFLPMDEVRRLGRLEGAEINEAKRVLAFEVTRLVHGEEEARKSEAAAQALFGNGGRLDGAPSTDLDRLTLAAGLNLLDLLLYTDLFSSKSDARRNVQQGGVYLNEERVDDPNLVVTDALARNGVIEVRKGKKNYHLLRVV
ncbi:MAG: tyrosine--tRNA ligase [Bacillota bacterium]|jgi:tyrosyl-tRNA synthetase